MAYDFYLGEMLLPVPPAKLQVKINGNNRKMTLINDGEINILKSAGLTDITFSALLPNVKYPFATYSGGFRNASYYLGILEKLKTDMKPFQFIVSRFSPKGAVWYENNITVSLENYTIIDDAKSYGLDIMIDVTLKQYKEYGTKNVEVKNSSDGSQTTITVESQRAVENSPKQDNYTVISGDSLWSIAQKMLGDGNRYTEIYEANKSVIDGQNNGTGNTKYTIYAGQVLTIP